MKAGKYGIRAAAAVIGILVCGNIPETTWGLTRSGIYPQRVESGRQEDSSDRKREETQESNREEVEEGISDEDGEKSVRTIRIHVELKKEYGQKDPEPETGFREALRECMIGELTSEEAENHSLIEKLLDAVHPSYTPLCSADEDPGEIGDCGEFRTGTTPVSYRFQDVIVPGKEDAGGRGGSVCYHFEAEGESTLRVVRTFRPVEGVSYWVTGLNGFSEHRTGMEGETYRVTAADCYEVSSGDGPDAVWKKELVYCGLPGENTHTFYIRDRTGSGGGRISETCRLTVKIRPKDRTAVRKPDPVEDSEAEQIGERKTEEGVKNRGREEPELRERKGTVVQDRDEAEEREREDAEEWETERQDVREIPEAAIRESEEPGVQESEEPGVQKSEEPGVRDSEQPGIREAAKPQVHEAAEAPGKKENSVMGELRPLYISDRETDRIRGSYVQTVRDGIRFTGYHTEGVSEKKSELRVTRDGVMIGDPVLLRKAARDAAPEKNDGSPGQFILPESLFSREGVYRISFVNRDETGAAKDSDGDLPLVFCVDRTAPALSEVRLQNRRSGSQLVLEAFDTGGVRSVRILQDGRSVLEKRFRNPDPRAAVSARLEVPPSGSVIRIVLEDTAGNMKSEEYQAGSDGTLSRRDRNAAAASGGEIIDRKEKEGKKTEVPGIVIAAAFAVVLTAGVTRRGRRKEKEED